MTIKELIDSSIFQIANEGEDLDNEISQVYCCDLLSFAMGKAPANCAWVTVIGNINTIAVASLADVSCIILSEDAKLDDAAFIKAREQGIPVFYTELPSFEAALKIHTALH
ncbi:MAG: hypothetical protein ACI4CT_05620 [Lachnospiraceae bacterium]